MKRIISFIKENKPLSLVLLLVHLTFFFFALTFKNIYTEDSFEYIQQAENIKHSGSFYSFYPDSPHDDKFYTLRPPLYGLFILGSRLILKSDFFILILQNILSLFTCLGLAFLFQEFHPEKKFLRLIPLSLIFFPTSLIMTNQVMSDILLQFFIFWAFYFMIFYFKKKKNACLLWYNIFLTLAVFTKPVLLFFWLPNVLFTLYLAFRSKNFAIVLLPLIMPAAISLWSYNNRRITGYYHFSSIQNINLCYFNAKFLMKEKYGDAYADSVISDIKLRSKQFPDLESRDRFLKEQGTAIIKKDLVRYIYVHTRGMINFMLNPGKYDLVSFFPVHEKKEVGLFNEFDSKGLRGIVAYLSQMPAWLLVYMSLIFLWNVFVLISVILFFFNSRVDIHYRILLLLLGCYICILSGALGFSRFKVQVFPLFIFTLPFFLSWIFCKVKRPLL